jgi:peroxiredoxin
MKKYLRFFFVTAVIMSISLQSCSKKEEKSEIQLRSVEPKAKMEQPARSNTQLAPDFQLTDHNGQTVKLSDYSGKVVVLNFWATWCGPCRMEIPGFVKLREKYYPQGAEFIGISMDQPGWKVVKPFMEEYNINYPIVLGNRQVVMAYGGITGIPTTFIINQQGEVVDKIVGYRQDSYFESAITKLLKS